MRLSDDMEERERVTPPIVSALGGVCFVIIIIVVLVLYMNKDKLNDKQSQDKTSGMNSVQQDEDDIFEISGSNLKPEDFDFWEMYPENTPVPLVPTPTETEEPQKDPSQDGKHTLIINDSGEEEWVPIDENLKKHSYDLKNFVYQSDRMKYYKDNKVTSFLGVDISERQGYVDYNNLKKSGIDFCMIRVGARGYGSGQLILDENFSDNMKRAFDAGMDVGVYFFSQAITQEEVMEEANLVLEELADYNITYPVVFWMEYVENDTARVEQLTKTAKTEIAKIFLDTMRTAGYTPMLYGKKEWLIKKLDLSMLEGVDIWLAQYEKTPDYPYAFSMWQFTNHAIIDGISGNTGMSISLIDFSEK